MSGSRTLFACTMLVCQVVAGGSAQAFDAGDFARTQAARYEKAEWNLFFGGAQAYRQYWWNREQHAGVVLLEISALIRLCRYEDATTLAVALEREKLTSGQKVLLARLQASMPGIKKYGVVSAHGKTLEPSSRRFDWPVSDDSASRMDPAMFAVKVKPSC